MSEFIHLNGTLLPGTEAMISPLDRGFLYGDGIFETIGVYGGTPFLLDRHLVRMERGAGILGYRLPERGVLLRRVGETLSANALIDGSVRITATRGIGGALFELDRPDPPTILITCREIQRERGIPAAEEVAVLHGVRHSTPLIGRRLKSLDYLPAILAAPELKARNVREGILLDHNDMVCSGTVSNIFCVDRGRLHTPPLTLGILDGITRGMVLELAARLDLPTVEESFDPSFLFGADECFYTNSVRELVPIVAIDGERIGTGSAGAITSELVRCYRAEIGEGSESGM